MIIAMREVNLVALFMNEEFSQFDTLRMACLVLKMTNGIDFCVYEREI